MLSNHFKKPVVKTICIIGFIVLLIEVLGIAHWGGITGFLAQSILFPVGLAIGLAVTVAVIVGIFLAAVFMADRDLALQFWQKLKQNCPCYPG